MTEAGRSPDRIRALLACPSCGGALSLRGGALVSPCGKSYEMRDGVAYFTQIPIDFEQDGNGPNVAREAWGAWRTRNFEYVKEAFNDLSDEASVLDLGAGPGQFDELLARFAKVVSMDFRAFATTNVVADLTKPLPLQSGAFDAVMASNVLEHIPDTRALLAEVRRVLKPGGRFVATIPFMMRVHQKPYDFNRYTNFQLEALARTAGFSDVRVEALSTPLEVHETNVRHFYAAELAQAKGLRALMLRACRFFDRARLGMLARIARAAPSLDYTEGYGVHAR